ncbi:carbohydrate kinase [Melghirimyces algeriensis]|uniref:Pseudouridine kinase n=1 Tax=Melghirimyces algeriensis TaxID=910412 RepID=A0A521BUE2_9BACL|nr:carbohydrate kinase [Melghirimyces algeriensis]SMO50789.1 pseudouridine kinase [Melghirimyces algeriensis]
MKEKLSEKEVKILELIRENPYISQQELSKQLCLSRSAVAGYISSLTRKGKILGRAYILPKQRGVVCIGGANLDRKAWLSGELQAKTSNPVHISRSYGGVARNIAENLAKTGMQVSLLTVVGDDREGEEIVKHCQEAGIDVSLLEKVSGVNTGNYTAVLQPDGEMAFALAEMDVLQRLDHSLLERFWSRIRAGNSVVVDTNLSASVIEDVIRRCRADEIFLCMVPVSVPKANRLPEDASGVALWIGNADELSEVTGVKTRTQQECEYACHILMKRGVHRVVVTRGSSGVYFMEADGECGWLESLPSGDVVDVTGAGDAFAAGVVGSLHQHFSLREACQKGLTFAMLTLKTEASVSTELSPKIWE